MKRVAFVALSAWLVVLFLIAVGLDATQEWTVYQRRFVKSLNRDERRGLPGGIQQIQVKPLGRVDRCTTCHLAIDQPQLALAEEPFTALSLARARSCVFRARMAAMRSASGISSRSVVRAV